VKPLAARPRTGQQPEYSAVGVQQRALGILLVEADSGEHGLRPFRVVRHPRVQYAGRRLWTVRSAGIGETGTLSPRRKVAVISSPLRCATSHSELIWLGSIVPDGS
jgi:hypothetical protein